MSEAHAVRVEICVDSPKGLAAAIEGGADRIELCAALALGGLTPSPGLMRLAAQAPVPVHALIRPRAGGFSYDEREIAAMGADIAAAREAGLAGVVIGASRPDGTLDEAVLVRLCEEASGLAIVLHRAFDLVPDPFAAVEAAVSLGFSRILTSGGARSAAEGADRLAALVAKAGGRLTIMPGAGISSLNAAAIVARTGAREIHASARASAPADPRLAAFGFAPEQPAETSADVVRAIRDALLPGGSARAPIARGEPCET